MLPPNSQTGPTQFHAAATRQPPPSAESSANVQGIPLEELIVQFDQVNIMAGKPNSDGKSSASGLDRANAFGVELDRRLESAIAGARQGDSAAIRHLVTIAAAGNLVGARHQQARAEIQQLTSSLPGHSAPPSSQNLASIKKAVTALVKGYGRALGKEAATWAKELLKSIPLDRRDSQVLKQLESQQRLESERDVKIKTQAGIATAAPVPSRSRPLYSDEVLAPALRKLAPTGFTLHEDSIDGEERRNFPAHPITSPKELAAKLVSLTHVQPARPAVTLYYKAAHWVALIAIPAKAGEEGARPTLIVFDSNAKLPGRVDRKQEESHGSQKVGRQLADALSREGFPVQTAFGSIQEGKAANACGPLCFAAIQHAFMADNTSEAMSAERVTGRLIGFIDQFEKMPQGGRDDIVQSAEQQILDAKAKSDAKSSHPAASLQAMTPARQASFVRTPPPSLAVSLSASGSSNFSAKDSAYWDSRRLDVNQTFETVKLKRAQNSAELQTAQAELRRLNLESGSKIERLARSVTRSLGENDANKEKRATETVKLESRIALLNVREERYGALEQTAETRLKLATKAANLEADISRSGSFSQSSPMGVGGIAHDNSTSTEFQATIAAFFKTDRRYLELLKEIEDAGQTPLAASPSTASEAASATPVLFTSPVVTRGSGPTLDRKARGASRAGASSFTSVAEQESAPPEPLTPERFMSPPAVGDAAEDAGASDPPAVRVHTRSMASALQNASPLSGDAAAQVSVATAAVVQPVAAGTPPPSGASAG